MKGYFIALIVIAIVGLFLFFILRKTKFKSKGQMGEDAVKRVIGKTKKYSQYVFNDYMLKNEDKTTQIDHIVINKYGVFVIETKNYSGRIYGNENQLEWTQVLSYGKVKNKLYNPLKQNCTHIYNINKVLNGNFPITSLVVFVQNNTAYIDASNVIPLYDLKKHLKGKGDAVLSVDQMEAAYLSLFEADVKGVISQSEHIENINKMKENLKAGICPRCGGELVERKGKYGIFWGCSNYPKCRFIKHH